jgi:hypothetical protein
MTNIHEKTVILGTEYDDLLRTKLRNALKRLGVKDLSHNWGVGGSQEIETLEVQVGSERVIVEAETYVGLSIRGPAELVDQIREMVNDEISGSN